MTLEFFHIVAETDEQETRTKLLELARTTTDMCGMGDCLFNCGDDAVEMMDQIWAAFLEAAAAENVESRRVLLEKAAAGGIGGWPDVYVHGRTQRGAGRGCPHDCRAK